MLSANKCEVKLAAHSDNWANLFQEEKELLNNLLGEHIQDI
ncbi:hypothetical protein SAMN04487944_12244 [Gracilibacillus ureilyticus]|uniref:Uncharacterized protein n=1 Tax=Gracilibacillus ureilyticus TaxID=531814 RepID=A0A1H9VAK9_9BACI|nr:hypothetical protein [Gracilibacillus ureilyticus]SES18303.1 hypothetical protein SAMN04487944_12244 [Gracilibacillus ureilyticus]